MVDEIEEQVEGVEVEDTVDGVEAEPQDSKGLEVDAEEEGEVTPTYDPEDEAEARLFGWKSRDEWKGDRPPNFSDDPKEYLGKIHNSRPFKVMNSRIEQITKQYEDQFARLNGMASQTLKAQQEQHQAQIASLKRQQRQAVEHADPDRYDQLDKAIDHLQKNAPQAAPEPPPQNQLPPEQQRELDAYRESPQGKWLEDQQMAQTAATMLDHRPDIRALGPTAQLRFAEQEMRRLYPEKFEQPKPTPAPKPNVQRVDGGGLASGAQPGGRFAGLPAAAKQQFKAFVADGIFTDTKEGREEYADGYYEAG